MDTKLAAFLYQALESPRGIILSTDDPQRLIPKLHHTRRELKDETLSSLIIAISRTDPAGEVWIVHQPAQPVPSAAQNVEASDAEEE